MKRKWFILPILALACLTAYAEVKPITVKTDLPLKKVWQACIDTFPDVKFSVASTDAGSGLIIAEKQTFGRTARTIRMNISVSEESGHTTIVVRYIPVSGQLGGGKTPSEYVTSLKKRLPDLLIAAAP